RDGDQLAVALARLGYPVPSGPGFLVGNRSCFHAWKESRVLHPLVRPVHPLVVAVSIRLFVRAAPPVPTPEQLRLRIRALEGTISAMQALDPTTGQSLWENDDPLAGGAAPVWDIVTDKTRLFGVGRRAGGFYELRAFDQATGAVLWRYPGANDPVTVATGIGVATGVGRVFTTGMTTPFGDPALGTHLFVRAHDAGTGQLFWQKDVDLGGYAAGYSVSYLSGVARTLLRGRPDTSGDHPRIPANAGLVVVTGYGYDANGDSFGDIRAYEPYSGQLLWEQTVGFPGSLNQLVALRRVGKRMVAVGTRTKALGFGTGDSKSQDGLIACYE